MILKVLKQKVSRDLRRKTKRSASGQLRLEFMEGCDGLPHFWQPRFYDFNAYSKKKEREKLEYMHANPVLRGLVKHPAEWVWSSFSWYEKGEIGLIPVDVAK